MSQQVFELLLSTYLKIGETAACIGHERTGGINRFRVQLGDSHVTASKNVLHRYQKRKKKSLDDQLCTMSMVQNNQE